MRVVKTIAKWSLAGLLALAGTVPAWALTATPVFVQTPKLALVQLTNASGTAVQTLYTCGANGSKITGLVAATTDSSNDTLQIQLLRSTTTYLLTTQTVTANSGNAAGTPNINLFAVTAIPGLPYDSDGNPFLYCQSGDVLQANVTVAVTSGKLLSVWAIVADF